MNRPMMNEACMKKCAKSGKAPGACYKSCYPKGSSKSGGGKKAMPPKKGAY